MMKKFSDHKKVLTPFGGGEKNVETTPSPGPAGSEGGGDNFFQGPAAPRMPPSPCLGCGYCCATVPCYYGMLKYHTGRGPCPGLYWNGERYRCKHVDDPRLHHEVAIGAGCCSALNSWRGPKILQRSQIEKPLPPEKVVEL